MPAMKSSLTILCAFMALSLAPPAWSQPASGTVSTGVVRDPCASLPPMPASMSAYRAAIERAKASGQAPPAAPANLAEDYGAWQKTLLSADFANLCRYEAQNRSLGAPSRHRLVFMGDSITQAWAETRPSSFQGDRIGRGIGGQTTSQMLGRFRADVIALRPERVLILAGTNDIAGNTGPTSLERIEANLQSMVDLATANGIKVGIATVLPADRYAWRPGINPVPSILALNAWIRQYANSHHLLLIDYFDALNNGRSALSPEDSKDGVHPTAAGYAKMERVLSKALGTSDVRPR
jgi:lysophospholipase L1-like esterase